VNSDGEKCESCNNASCPAKHQRPDESREAFLERRAIAERLCRIRHKILVLSGKGGVGKSTVAVNLALCLSQAGRRVGLLDVDIHGPSIPRLLRLEGSPVQATGKGIMPVEAGMMKVMSIGFLLDRRETAVIWRGPMKMNLIRQFLKDVEWGDLDYLVIDSPPGTGDEPLSVCQLIEDADGAVVVTTPQELALDDVRKSVTFCRSLELPVLGVIENMSGLVCPRCGERIDVFKRGGGKRLAEEMGVPFLGEIPVDLGVMAGGDCGRPVVVAERDSSAAQRFCDIAKALDERLEGAGTTVSKA